MRLRPYIPEDFAVLYAIEEQCFESPFRFGRQSMKKLLEARCSAAWIAELDGAMAGFAIVEWTEATQEITAYIQTLEVAPAFRSRGLGAALLAQCENSAREAGAFILWLHVADENAGAIRLYESHGFNRLANEADFYAPGRGAHVYAKPLV
ncbi:MAG: N-acetyltransferase [Acidobacteriaceae bacterium]|nr:N-acetyltransferase [Acidobacteriaceae bacterium]